MAYKLKILSEMELCLLSYSGHVEPKDFEEVWERAGAAKDYSPAFDDIAILCPDADYSDIAYEVVLRQSIRFVELYQVSNLKREKRCAFVCSNEMQIAMATMFGAVVSSHGVRDFGFEAFTSLGPALQWIENGARSGRTLDRLKIDNVIHQLGAAWCLTRSAA